MRERPRPKRKVVDATFKRAPIMSCAVLSEEKRHARGDLDAIRFKGYAFQIEMKFTAYKLGFKIKEVPVIFVNRELGTSKMSGGIFGEALFGVIKLRIASMFGQIKPKA